MDWDDKDDTVSVNSATAALDGTFMILTMSMELMELMALVWFCFVRGFVVLKINTFVSCRYVNLKNCTRY